VEPSDLTALRSAAGQRVLTDLGAATGADPGSDPLALATRLRAAGHPPALVAAALTQARLRARAVTKLGSDAGLMFFTPDGVEQATRGAVAGRRAARLVAAGARHVLDLGCGIGADLIAFARAGLAVTGIERDPATAAIAAANVDALGLAGRVEVRCADATTLDLGGGDWDAAFCDPARRAGGRRVFDPDAYSPSWSFLLELAARVPLTVVKVAPGIDHDRIPAGTEAEWVSDHGDVVEAALWSGPAAEVPRRASLLPAGVTLTGSGGRSAPVGPLLGYLHDPDGAVVRAHLVAELADRLDATLVDPSIAYLTTAAPSPSAYARTFTVDEVLPVSVKAIRAALARRGVGTLEIKKRGSPLLPEELRPQLKLRGPNAATLVLTRVAGARAALICSPYRTAARNSST
jgi:hypothetical protein